MKKIIGILGVVIIAATMFFTNNTNVTSSDTNLASLMNMNVAHAQTESPNTQRAEVIWCSIKIGGVYYLGRETICTRGNTDCTIDSCVEYYQ